MHSGGGVTGNGRNPGDQAAPPPPGRSSSSSSGSPSSSSTALCGSGHLGFESIQQLQQQLAFLQQQQQPPPQHQHLRKAEGEDAMTAYNASSVHGLISGCNLSSSSSTMLVPHPQRKCNDSSAQLLEENQGRGQFLPPQMQNPVQQAYAQFALQAAQLKYQGDFLAQEQGKGDLQDMLVNNSKMQDLMSLQSMNQTHASLFKRPGETFPPFEKKIEQRQAGSDEKNELKRPHLVSGQLTSANMPKPMQSLHSQATMVNTTDNQMAMAQLQAMQNWAREHNIDLSHPSNLNLITQFLPLWQHGRVNTVQGLNETTLTTQSNLPLSNVQGMFSLAASEISGQGIRDLTAQAGHDQELVHATSFNNGGSINDASAYNNMQIQQQVVSLGREGMNGQVGTFLTAVGNRGLTIQMPQSTSFGQLNAENMIVESDAQWVQNVRSWAPVSRSTPPPAILKNIVATQIPPQSGSTHAAYQPFGFTKPQLHVLKAQILAFRRLKRGEHALPLEVLQAIAPPPLENNLQHAFLPSALVNQERQAVNNMEGIAGNVLPVENCQEPPLSMGNGLTKEEPFVGEEKVAITNHSQGVRGVSNKPTYASSNVNAEQNTKSIFKSEQQEVKKDCENVSVKKDCENVSVKIDNDVEKVKDLPAESANGDTVPTKKLVPANNTPLSKDTLNRKYHGPLFDFPSFSKKHDSLGSNATSYASNLVLSYDANELLFEVGKDVLNKRRAENLTKITGLLAVNLERKRIRPDLVLKLQIEERKHRLLELQARLRDKVDQEQQEIMVMSDRPYRKFIKQCERQRIDLIRQVQQLQKASREKQLKSIFQWRKKLLEVHWAIRDARTTRNRGVAKYHERMLREFSKRKDDDRNRRMEALKNNDVDRYREMLLEQQTNVPGDAAQRYAVLSSFLSQTEEYLHKLGGKIAAAKSNQEMEEAANAAVAAARAQGFSEEEVKAAAACAGQEVLIRNKFSEINAPKENSSVNKYYNLAHAVSERVMRQPSMLRTGTLRDYQLVGLQWMLSLYNNKLNGILADEMGLGKTVQVMALIAYLMEFKGNYGPHLIIVPNAVLVNWKSELLNWLPSVTCIFYVGGKDQRSKLFIHEVSSVKFNVLVTTYEFVMYDRSKLSKINWKYIIIDEAQRMKDRESVLARDLDRYHCQRRLLLTGTPLQNDLKELWSLLNLLLPEVFDNRKAFHDWFSKPFQRDGASQNTEEDDWLETEKKVIIIHRLHQILEPFMLRRRVEDVEGSLPRKVSIVLRCRMSAIQSTVYDWIKSTGTIRVNPDEELHRAQKNPLYQMKMYRSLNNKCMELRKICNHPLLNYPYYNDYSKDFIVRSCGKLWILDRILLKLQRAGHRVLLFSTMTKLLDILEEYLQWRHLIYRRIDGTTSLEDREAAIVDFNSPDSDCFIFLLSIRAAGRGLNLQTADTVVIYDPDPNPQNEEQAVARAHRIGQKREVKVIYMEAVVDKITSFQREDELRIGVTGDSDDDLAGKDRYMGSIESLIRNNIQQYKIDMADEVINAGRFDQRTTHEERRMTLETLLHDEERYQETVHDVPSLHEVNRLIARNEEEVEIFDQMDEEFDWTGNMINYSQVPKWLRVGSKELNAVTASLSKKPSKNMLDSNFSTNPSEHFSGSYLNRTDRRRGRPKGSSDGKKHSIYIEVDEDDDFDTSSEDALGEEETEIGEFEDELDVTTSSPLDNKDQLDEGLVCDDAAEDSPQTEGLSNVHSSDERGSTGSSSGSRGLPQPTTLITLQKFGSLSALESRQFPPSKSKVCGNTSLCSFCLFSTFPFIISSLRQHCFGKFQQDELEEGEIAISGDSMMELQQSGSWAHDREEDEEQPKIKRRRSIRIRPKNNAERLEEKTGNERISSVLGSQMFSQGNHDYDVLVKTDQELDTSIGPITEASSSSYKQIRNLLSRKAATIAKQNTVMLAYGFGPFGSAEVATEHSRASCNAKAVCHTQNHAGTKMPDNTRRKCKNVISKLQKKIDKEGSQTVPILFDLWKRNNNPSLVNSMGNSFFLDLQRIEQRVDMLDYNAISDLIADVQLMLKTSIQYCNNSHEVKCEAAKVHDLFFDIMKIAFPETDFQEARNAQKFSSPTLGRSAPSKQLPSSHSRRLPKAEADPGSSPSAARGHAPAHPADLVICKKRRNDRDKQRAGPASPVTPGWVSPLPSPNQCRASPAMSPSTSRSTRGAPLAHSDANSGGLSPHPKEIQWAKPVKRMRTDAGKRRPSHL
ncbi:ATP-dependent helicase BRM [Apostasia shenzhenica]|uniref:ATP-dependent helicase BRM n=1 Tax=Apostasia shenzhenica TaxID=1088818 RepID=A0A2I0ATC8_9ASPA|nr:ATP-dependent helicase BRM [Apostasia shenzhenica]